MERYDDALAYLNRAIELDPGNDFAISKRTELSEATGSHNGSDED